MEVADVQQGTGVQKSSTSMSESSKEVSVEQTAHGSIESSVSQQKNFEQSVQKTQQSTRVVQQSVTSSSSDENFEKSGVENVDAVVANDADGEPINAKEEPPKKIIENVNAQPTAAAVVKNAELESEEEYEEEEEYEGDEVVEVSEEIEESADEEDNVDATTTVVIKRPVARKATSPVQLEKSEEKSKENEKKQPETESVKPVEKPSPPIERTALVETSESEEDNTKTEETKQPEKKVTSTSSPSSQPPASSSAPTSSPPLSSTTASASVPPPKQEKPSELPPSAEPEQNETQPAESSAPPPSTATPFAQQQSQQPPVGDHTSSEIKQENIKNSLKEIISDIDRVIERGDEHSTIMTSDVTKSSYINQQQQQYRENVEDVTAGLPKPIDLQKIFTPAEDADEILPQKNRKLYASSAFFTPGLHPTVEDQVELARRISSSLSDISNQQSKGQTMYVNRKKRSVKWVHEGEGRADIQQYNGYSSHQETKENGYNLSTIQHEPQNKLPLKLVMDPRGQVQDMSTYRNHGMTIDNSGMLSPDRCAELVSALHAPKGKGAELFAKRRKRSEKWIVDETTAATRSPSGVPYAISPTTLPTPAYTDVGTQRVQGNIKLDQIQAKYAEPRIKMIQTPWDAALETGSASNAFQEAQNVLPPRGYGGNQQSDTYSSPVFPSSQLYQENQYQKTPSHSSYGSSSLRDLAYKPSIPQGWNAPPPNLPRDIYTPPELPINSYAPPPTTKYVPPPSQYQQYAVPRQPPQPAAAPRYSPYQAQANTISHSPASSLFTSPATAAVRNPSPTVFAPSPISNEKLAIFENRQQQQYSQHQQYHHQPNRRPLTVANTIVRNQSPISFGSASSPATKPSLGNYATSKIPGSYYPPQQSPQQPSTQYHQTAVQPQPQQKLSKNLYIQSDDSYSYGSSSLSQQTSPRISLDLNQLENYNRAARGWGQMKDFYRPITFSKPKIELPYTDF